MARILVAAHVPPRPAIKAALLYMRDVVRHEIVAQAVALVHRAPQFAGVGAERDASAGIAYAVGVDPLIVPSGLNSRMSARFLSAGVVSGSSTFEPEPTATSIFFPSGVNCTERVQ